MTGSYDAALNLIYWGVGNPAADFYGGDRAGANLYTDCIVALDADTGKLKWYFQQVPHDVWDFDSAYENVLVDLPVKGQARKLLINVNKGGYAFVIDRETGKFVSGWPIVKNLNWIRGTDEQGNLVGRNEPVPGKPSFICPSIAGGRQWNQAAFSPRTVPVLHHRHRVVPGSDRGARGSRTRGRAISAATSPSKCRPMAMGAAIAQPPTTRLPAKLPGDTNPNTLCWLPCWQRRATWCFAVTRKGRSLPWMPTRVRNSGRSRPAQGIAGRR